jgi:aldose 1-epimerase
LTQALRQRPFGSLPDGREVVETTLDNGRGLALSTINLGGIVTALRWHGVNLVLGLPTLDDYVHRNQNFGTIVGRCANRIAGGRFELHGVTHELSVNDGSNTLHGGRRGFGSRWWNVEPLPPQADGSVALALGHVSEHGDEGFPGRLEVDVRYTLTAKDAWRIDYRATTDRPTVVNLTHHDYWNLAGSGSVLGHELTLAASHFTSVGPGLIPRSVEPVAGTPFDFRTPRAIAGRVREPHPQIVLGRGYDHHWILDRDEPGDGDRDVPAPVALAFAARLEDPASGRWLKIETTEPGIQFYSGNFLDATRVGSGGAVLRQGDGCCLETQHAPDSPNRPEFPSVVLRPGRSFSSTTVHHFGGRS